MRLAAKGKVFLVGAGPGDPELLTLKALRVLREADIVLHDDLVSSEILALLPRTATIVAVGKRCGRASVTQEEINTMLVTYAASGRTVVRLKSGDPMLFGRAGEEIDALRAARLDFEIVPGVSAGFAAAAVLGASLTDRRKSSRVVFSAGHRSSGVSQHGATHVVYMPGSDYAQLAASLLAEGLTPETACVIVSAVSREMEAVHRTTLGSLPDIGPLPAPALLLAGDVFESREEFGQEFMEQVVAMANSIDL